MSWRCRLKPDINSIIERVLNGDDMAFAELCGEYEPLIRSMSVKYAQMADETDKKEVAEDLSQEATLALYRAAQTYRSGNGEVSFGLYAKVCIRNALISELRRMSRKKKTDKVHERELLMEQEGQSGAAKSGRASFGMPDIEFIAGGDLLSPFEKRVFDLYAGGMKIRDIADSLGRSSKSVSNAVFRIKSKVRMSYGEDTK